MPSRGNSGCLLSGIASDRTDKNELKHGAQILVTVYVRDGMLLSVDPRNPNKSIALTVREELKAKFEEWKADYKSTIALAAKVNISELSFNQTEGVRFHREGSTLVVDYPRLSCSDSKTGFEVRTCFAICTGKKSSKAWTRITLPVGSQSMSPRVHIDKVKELYLLFQEIADSSVEWAYSKMDKTLTQYMQNSAIRRKGIVRVKILGIKDDSLAGPFERLREPDTTAKDILQDMDIDKKLTFYCKYISDVDGMLSSYTGGKQSPKEHSWFKITLWVELQNGYMEPRVVLFLMRELKEFTEVIGLAYDDSVNGDLALRAGAAFSRRAGIWI